MSLWLKPLPNHVPKCPKRLDVIILILVCLFQPASIVIACFNVGSKPIMLPTNVPCLYGIGTGFYIVIAPRVKNPAGYNYYAVLVLSAVNFLADNSTAGSGIGTGFITEEEDQWVPFSTGGLYAAQAILWLIYLIIVAVAVSKHRKAGGHSKWIPGEPNPRDDDTIPDPLSSTDLSCTRGTPPDENMYQLGSLHLNESNTRNLIRLDSFGDPVQEERCTVGGEQLDNYRTTPVNGSPVSQQEGICGIGGENTGERVQIVVTEERTQCC